MRLRLFKILALAFCLLSWSAAGEGASKNDSGLLVTHPDEITAGNPFTLKIGGLDGLKDPQLLWLDKKIPLQGLGRQGELLLPTPLSAQGEITLTLLSGGIKIYSADLRTRSQEFGSQHLTVEPRYVHPPEKEKNRIERERAKMREIYARITQEQYLRLPLERPAPGAITGEFGVSRMFNNEPRSRHLGVDFRGAEGSEARAVSFGKVALTASHYYSGNTVVLDHGLGVYSVYMHLSSIKVKPGQIARPGQTVGLVGSTGRVTGPHLHLSLVILGEAQNAEACMAEPRPSQNLKE
ncbi:MAG: M23 family metallopeptidase [Desulfovibrionaceae bacterium]|nr:M23 family metallopeptidase [Desulfovibrionaceae bacterium]